MQVSAQLDTPTVLPAEKEPAVPIEYDECASEPIWALRKNERSVAFAYSQTRIPCSFTPQDATMPAEIFCLQGMIVSDSVSKRFYFLFVRSLNSKVEQYVELATC